MARKGQQAAPRDLSSVALLVLVGGGFVLAVLVATAVSVADWWSGKPWRWRHPAAVVFDLGSGEVAWSATASLVLAGELVVLACVAVATYSVLRRVGVKDRREWRAAAGLMSSRRDVHTVVTEARETANRVPDGEDVGVLCGRSVLTGEQVFAPWDHCHLDVWGVGRGKGTARMVPAIVRAPGAVVTTSIDTDVLDATRAARDRVGRTWVFDPQNLAGEQPTWWWNPLAGIDSLAKADDLADVIAGARLEDTQRDRDPFLDPKARKLLALAIYAAAVADRPLTDIYLWLTDPEDTTLESILDGTGNGLIDDAFGALRRLPQLTRDSVYQGAEFYVDWLLTDHLAEWVTNPSSTRDELLPEEFVGSRDTLYLLARKGKGTAAPLTTALAATILRTADRHARASRTRRLDRPLVAVLDEPTNVFRWRRLPDLYSHYRSRGIVLMTFIPSWSQGVQLWGSEGMKVLWDAATCKIYGGGCGDSDFLKLVSDTIGEWEKPTQSGSRSAFQFLPTGWQDATRPKAILPVSDLAALPAGMMVAMLAGVRPLLLTAERRAQVPDVATVVRAPGPETVSTDRSVVDGDAERRSVFVAESGTILDWLRRRNG